MAKRKALELSPEAQAANAAGEAGREKERRVSQANAEKQKRFRENMKAGGFRQVLLWDFPCPADVRKRMTAAGFWQAPAWEAAPSPGGKGKPLPSGMVKAAVALHESSLGIAGKAPEIKQALSAAQGDITAGKAFKVFHGLMSEVILSPALGNARPVNKGLLAAHGVNHSPFAG
jgi:hypothetical protein